MWFTEIIAGKIGRVDRSGTITEFPLPTGFEFPSDIAFGPGGMWFTATEKIGRIRLSGAITLFPRPNPGGGADGITRGPDGNMWYADQVGLIGRITPKGKITEFPVPGGADKVPFNIAKGPDGNVWFTELIGNAVGRVRALPGHWGGRPHTTAPSPAQAPHRQRYSSRWHPCGPGGIFKVPAPCHR